MAKFRMIHTEFWNDPRVVEDFTPEDRFFYLYLLTNSNTTQIGIYQITKKQIAFDMGYSIESANALIDRFVNHHQLIAYNPETRELAIKNWGKYNLNRGGKPVIDCVKSELREVKDAKLIELVAERIEKEEIKKLYDSYNDSSSLSSDDTEDESSTTSGQEKEEEKEEQEYKEQQQKDLSGGRDGDFLEVIDFYRNNLQIGVSETVFNTELLIQFYEEWGKELLIAAMKLAAQKEAKGTAFVEAVLKNWKEAGVKSVEDARKYQLRFKSKNKNGPTKADITPDWYQKQKEEEKRAKKQESKSKEQIEKESAEADKLLEEYLAQNA